jgi:hypothetical protein
VSDTGVNTLIFAMTAAFFLGVVELSKRMLDWLDRNISQGSKKKLRVAGYILLFGLFVFMVVTAYQAGCPPVLKLVDSITGFIKS